MPDSGTRPGDRFEVAEPRGVAMIGRRVDEARPANCDTNLPPASDLGAVAGVAVPGSPAREDVVIGPRRSRIEAMYAAAARLRGRDWDVNLGAVVVAAAMAAASWNALMAVASAAGFPAYLAWTFPLGVDGLVYIGLRTTYILRRAHLRKRAWVWVVLTYAFLVSFTGNGMHSTTANGGAMVLPSWELPFVRWHAVVSGAWLASTVPAVSAMFAIHLLVVHRRAREEMGEQTGRRHRSGWRRRLGLWLAGAPDAELQAVSKPRPPASTAGRPRARSTRRRAGRRSETEVLAMVRRARERLVDDLGREPDDGEVASQMSADGHPLSASRVRFYLPKVRTDEGAAAEEVVAWHGR
jgi:Protein of unknown function (DUF2637)